MNEPGYGKGDTSFQAAGGVDGIQKLVEDFYAIMATREDASELFAMHPEDIDVSIDKLARFLCGWLGGPKRYKEKYGGIAIPPAHSHLPISDQHRLAWLACMSEAAERQPYDPGFRTYLLKQLAVPAARIVELKRRMNDVAEDQAP